MNIMSDVLSMPLSLLILFILTIFPVKMGADLFGAENNAVKRCIIAMLLQMLAVIFLIATTSGFLAFVLIYTVVSMIYWQVLKISFLCSFAFTVFVLVVQFALLHLLSKIAMLILPQF